ncbi:MAG: single-stranded-DNA-specific exonuclease RecJ [Bdellovibrionales bacterium]|nr:single-stranded-DNA-specific exonuclease RecJ [Bdellovibrionales bacterium]
MSEASSVTDYVSREWRFQELKPSSEDLVRSTGLSPVTVDLCLRRNLNSAQEIAEYLSPKLERLTSPWRLKDMRKAVERMGIARQAGETVWVFGDYDVDGTTGAALLGWFFRELKIPAVLRQPDRFKDGYGLNVGAVEEAHSSGARLIITVDCGITSFSAAQRAQELGLDLIVLDHHQLDREQGVPMAFAVVNPQQEDCESGLKQICGCGLAFYFAMALRSYGREQAWWKSGSEPNLKQHLDLVVMATAADIVPLTGDNHILVRHGMEVLRGSRKPGVRALLAAAGVADREISPGHLGFVLGPRINASGRMGSASTALELLTTEDSQRAMELAQQLERINAERAELQNQIWDEVRQVIEEGISCGRFQHGIAVADSRWHEGVVGIVASRVVETYRRPAVVMSVREKDVKGSARTFAGKDVLQALRGCADLLLGFGGHTHAAGLTLDVVNFERFQEAFDAAVKLLPEDSEQKPLHLDGQLRLEDLDLKTLQEIERLGPFGPGNPEPVFALEASLARKTVLKGRHLKMTLTHTSQNTPKGSGIEAIWFHAAEHLPWLESEAGQLVWAGVPELNRFRGKITPTFRIRDVRRLTS